MNKNVMKRVIQVVVTLAAQGILLFVSAGTVMWQWAWIFLLLGIVILIINFFVLPVELVAERGTKKENVKKWDRILTSVSIIPYLGMFIVCGLDYRYEWSGDLDISLNVSGLILYFLGSMLFTWSMISNKYFSTMVRIQLERDHSVATNGPYKYVRHPGYVGFILFTLATPLALGALHGLLIAGIMAVIFIIRTRLEDKTLKAELKGYADYSAIVRYKLIPFLW